MPSLSNFSGLTGSAGAALVCSVLAQYYSSRRSELCSEVLCWLVLPVVFVIAQGWTDYYGGYYRAQQSSSNSQWIAALGIAAVCIFKAEFSIIGLFPALTPLLLVAQGYLSLSARMTQVDSDSWSLSALSNTIWGTSLLAAILVAILSDWDYQNISLSFIPAALMCGVYITFMPSSGERPRFLPFVDIESSVRSISLRVIVLLLIALGVEVATFGFPSGGVIGTIRLGLMKALSWYFLIKTARYSSWRTAAAIGTFSIISNIDPFKEASESKVVTRLVASFFALGQAIYILPKQVAPTRSALWIVYSIALAPYLVNIFTIHLELSAQITHYERYPMEVFIDSYTYDFESLVRGQSQNYTAACDEYKRRYHSDPPPGFEAWYRFAESHQSLIIDEFDSIYYSISPFWKLSGKDVLKAINDAQNIPGNELWSCTFNGSLLKTQCHHDTRSFDRHIQLLFDTLIKNIPRGMPDVNFLVNHLDEPRIAIPTTYQAAQINLTDLSRRPIWPALLKHCRYTNSSDNQFNVPVETYGLPFVTDRSDDINICKHPEYTTANGFFMSPTSFLFLEGLVPILSTGSLQMMGDILYPSPAYIESEFQYNEKRDIEWSRKERKLYWAGSTTGAFATDSNWRSYHRQRFVALAQNLESRDHLYIREISGGFRNIKSSFLNSRLYNVFFTKIFQCEPRQCREQRAYFHNKPWADKDEALQSQLVFDIDGNAISGRYYKLLASKSAPLKQTLLREWHDDRLFPWVHYIPVSHSMEELPEMVAYLTSTEFGQKRAKQIADQGRAWFSKAFREVDLTIYIYRLLLELARLQDPERPAA